MMAGESLPKFKVKKFMELTLLFREYCGLCHQMREALLRWQQKWNFTLKIIDVDDDEQLVEQYNELVPVLLHGKHMICYWHLDEVKLQDFLQKSM